MNGRTTILLIGGGMVVLGVTEMVLTGLGILPVGDWGFLWGAIFIFFGGKNLMRLRRK